MASAFREVAALPYPIRVSYPCPELVVEFAKRLDTEVMHKQVPLVWTNVAKSPAFDNSGEVEIPL